MITNRSVNALCEKIDASEYISCFSILGSTSDLKSISIITELHFRSYGEGWVSAIWRSTIVCVTLRDTPTTYVILRGNITHSNEVWQ